MADNASCTVYVGNLDERVTDRVVYDILIQAGPVVNLYIPRDKETDKLRGFAFAEYETEETAKYAVKLFSGLVTLYNRTLKFAISGQYQKDNKPSINSPSLTSSVKLKPPRTHPVAAHDEGKHLGRPSLVNHNVMKSRAFPNCTRLLSTSCRLQEHQVSYDRSNIHDSKIYEHSNGHRSRYNNNNYDYGGRVSGTTLDNNYNITRSRLVQYGTGNSSRHYYAPY